MTGGPQEAFRVFYLSTPRRLVLREADGSRVPDERVEKKFPVSRNKSENYYDIPKGPHKAMCHSALLLFFLLSSRSKTSVFLQAFQA